MIEKVCDELKSFLKEKNKLYGYSALNPIKVFSKHIKEENSQALNGMLVRLDDKIKRVMNAESLRENDVIDIAGYLILLCVENGWNDFDKFID